MSLVSSTHRLVLFSPTLLFVSRSDQPKNIELFKNKDLVIVFDKNNDLFRIIQANFTYDSKQLKCVFQYGNIENQIIDRYIRTKPLIDLAVSTRLDSICLVVEIYCLMFV